MKQRIQIAHATLTNVLVRRKQSIEELCNEFTIKTQDDLVAYCATIGALCDITLAQNVCVSTVTSALSSIQNAEHKRPTSNRRKHRVAEEEVYRGIHESTRRESETFQAQKKIEEESNSTTISTDTSTSTGAISTDAIRDIIL